MIKNKEELNVAVMRWCCLEMQLSCLFNYVDFTKPNDNQMIASLSDQITILEDQIDAFMNRSQ